MDSPQGFGFTTPLDQTVDQLLIKVICDKSLPPEWGMLISKGQTINVGRSSQNEISISVPSVSRAHLRLMWKREGMFVEDLNSKNGTKLNGKYIEQESSIKIGDCIQASEVTIIVLGAPEGEPAKRLLMAGSERRRHADIEKLRLNPQDQAPPTPSPGFHGGATLDSALGNGSTPAVNETMISNMLPSSESPSDAGWTLDTGETPPDGYKLMPKEQYRLGTSPVFKYLSLVLAGLLVGVLWLLWSGSLIIR